MTSSEAVLQTEGLVHVYAGANHPHAAQKPQALKEATR